MKPKEIINHKNPIAMKHTRTSLRSPRANSTFKTAEFRETYRMAEEILDILKKEKPGKAVSTSRIVNKAHALGYCRPLIDSERIAEAHPYWKILSGMTDPAFPLFINNLEEISTDNILRYRLRSDVVRMSSGNWKKVKGMKLLYSIPDNR